MLAGFFLLVTGSFVDNSFQVGWLSLIVGLASFIYGAFRKRIDPAAQYNQWMRIIQSLAFAAKAILLFNVVSMITVASLFVWSAVTLLLMFTEKKIFKPTVLGLSNSGVSIPDYFGDHLIPWELVRSLVVRPDYVTITRENHSYVQLEITADLDPKDMNRMNEFAAAEIAAHPVTETAETHD